MIRLMLSRYWPWLAILIVCAIVGSVPYLVSYAHKRAEVAQRAAWLEQLKSSLWQCMTQRPPLPLHANCINVAIHQQAVVLVHVVESHPGSPAATLLVRKSYEGPFAAGQELHVRPPTGFVCASRHCGQPYQFQVGDKDLLIITDASQEPMVLWPEEVWPAAGEAHELIVALDRAANAPPPNATVTVVVHDQYPSTVPYHEGMRLDVALRHALALERIADSRAISGPFPKIVRIVHTENGEETIIRNPDELKENPPLRPGDVVVVALP